jgi:hypothetical protein
MSADGKRKATLVEVAFFNDPRFLTTEDVARTTRLGCEILQEGFERRATALAYRRNDH